MKIIIDSTSKIVEVRTPDGGTFQARLWEGQTLNGVDVECLIVRIAARTEKQTSHGFTVAQDLGEFDRELQEHKPPSARAEAFPLRMIL